MLFNSFEFLIFFPTVTFLYFALPHKFRWILLLLASCIFYMAFIPAYIVILAVTILIDYFAAIKIEKTPPANKKFYLVLSIVSTCLVLFIFKYFNFFNTNFANLAQVLNLNYPISFVNIILPIGLSFHTFQSLSYVIEVYRGNQKAEHHFGIYSLYVMFYPQLVAGPIERPQNLLHQFYEKHVVDYKLIVEGLKQMAWGLFKKVVIADRLSYFVNEVYNSPDNYSGIPVLLATFFFAIQIYCDFSGYSDIAIGSAKVMGFRLMKNFDNPYFSKSIAEFWNRWHISLSTWLRDYLYTPIAIGISSKYFHLKNIQTWAYTGGIMVTWTVCGFWHGANWTYVIWGLMHGFFLVSALILKKKFKLSKKPISKIFTFFNNLFNVFSTFLLVCFSWVFFRAGSVSEALTIIKKSFDFSQLSTQLNLNIFRDPTNLALSLVFILIMAVINLKNYKMNLKLVIEKQNTLVRWSLYSIFLITIIFFGKFTSTEFIYFQF